MTQISRLAVTTVFIGLNALISTFYSRGSLMHKSGVITGFYGNNTCQKIETCKPD